MYMKIRKFGPECSDLPTMIWNINILLRIISLNVDSRQKAPISFVCYFLTASCTACYYYAYQFSLLWFVFWCPHTRNLGIIMVYGSLSISSHIATIKLFYMLVNASKVRCFVEQCLEFDALTEPSSRFSRSMVKEMRKVKIRAILVWLCVMLNSLLYMTVPAFLPGKHLPEDLLVFYGLEPVFETPNYQISYAIMFICVNFICYLTATITAFVIVIVGYTEAQMISLSKEILNLWDDSIKETIEFKIDHICAPFENKEAVFDDGTRVRINKGVRRRLVQIMRNHAQNISLLKKVNEFFNEINAVAFGCLVVSLIAELLGGLENTYLQIPFTFLQVAIDCIIGQKIVDASVDFERSVYNSKWENFDKDNMKIILLMLQNSQRTLTISAGGMAVMNFSSLMSIVRSVYSAYTTLRSMM